VTLTIAEAAVSSGRDSVRTAGRLLRLPNAAHASSRHGHPRGREPLCVDKEFMVAEFRWAASHAFPEGIAER
jgi:hypothetical protein